MALFVCDKCGCIENTALAHFWSTPPDHPKLCSECHPKIKKWHGLFEKKQWDGETKVINRKVI